jgi:predicted AAA+ superfamily ATPase
VISRHLEAIATTVARGFPVVTVTGPRQAGKTTLARKVFAHLPYASLEDPLEQHAFEADPRGWLARYPDGAVLDEIQRTPDLPRWLQGIVDNDRRMGRWILTGSQQLQVMDRVTQSLAGRVARLELMPFSHAELAAAKRAPADWAEAIWMGGYPPLYDRPVEPGRWLGDYIATYIERDVRSIAAVRDLTRFAAFLRLCAARTGQILNLASMAAELGVDAKTARGWLSVLVASYVVHLLPPHHANLGKRVVKHPKLYLLDTGLACRLLGINRASEVRGHASLGWLAETWIVSEAIKAERSRGNPPDNLFYWRSHDGLEVDLIVERGQGLFPIEIKSTTSPGPGDLKGIERFTALAPKRVQGGTLIHFGREKAKLRGHTLVPWTGVDTIAALRPE